MIDLRHGDSREVLKTVADNSLDSCVTDPPYALVSIGKRFGAENAAPAKAGKTGAYARASAGFMGQKWDTGDTAFDPEFWREVYRVLKPGAYVIAFGGTRTYHRLACAIEDAGFEIRDMVSWLYGSGFPKSHDVSKGIDKAAGAAGSWRAEDHPGRKGKRTRKADLIGQNTHANAANPEGFRHIYQPSSGAAQQWTGWGTALKPACEPCVLARKPLDGTVAANVLKWGTGALNIDGCRIGVEDESYARNASGDRGHDANRTRDMEFGMTAGSAHALGRWPANVIHDGSDEVIAAFPDSDGQLRAVGPGDAARAQTGIYGDYGPRDEFEPRNDAGSAARFFYTAKADATERLGTAHPTVKPTDLMGYFIRLATPPGGTVLDPFAGSGSTGVAAVFEGFDALIIEREESYVADARRRIAWAQGDGKLTSHEKKQPKVKPTDGIDRSLF